jgi:hypothetical protein
MGKRIDQNLILVLGGAALVGFTIYNLKSPISDITKGVKELTPGINETLKGVGKGVTSVANTVETLGNTVSKSVNDVVSTVTNTANEIVNTVIPPAKELTHQVLLNENLRSKQTEERGFGAVQPYGECSANVQCAGGTNIAGLGNTSGCQDGKCLPFVQSDDILGTYYSPKEKNIRMECGKYYLMGEGGPCASNSQCSSDGRFYDITQGGKSATVSSKYYCSRNNICSQKGRDFAGIYWKPYDISSQAASKLSYGPDQVQSVNEKIEKIAEASCPQLRTLKYIRA